MTRLADRGAGRSGLTLVEVAVVLMILAILLTLGFRASGLIDNRRLAGAVRVVASDIRETQQRARAERQCWSIVFEAGAERYDIQVLQGETAGPGTGCTPGRTGRWQNFRSIDLPDPIDLELTTFASDRLVLSPFGVTTPGSVTFRTPGGIRRVVSISPQGAVSVGPSTR